MTQPEQAIDIAAVEMHAQAPSKPAGASVVAVLTIPIELQHPHCGCLRLSRMDRFGWMVFGSLLLLTSIFTAMTRGRIALLVSAGIAVYYEITIIVPALR